MVARVTVNIADMVRRTQRKVETVANEFTQDMAQTAVDRTPVDLGFLVGSWFPSINDASASFEGEKDPSGANTIARLSVGISQAKLGDIIYILNGAEYAPFVEFGTRKMAPRAFVRSTVGDAPQIANETVNRIRRR